MSADHSRVCSRCRHGMPSAMAPGGIECRRFPPQLFPLPGPPTIERPNQPTINIQALHPVLDPDHFCGEFSPREAH